MVDMEKLESWPLDNLTAARGYTCENCGSREAISYSTASMEAAMKHLMQMRRTHKKFPYYFAKAVRKAEGINKRSKHGTRGHLHLVAS
jgi:hypothetical protein